MKELVQYIHSYMYIPTLANTKMSKAIETE